MPTLGVIAVISPLSMAGTSNAFQQNNMLQDRGWMGEGGLSGTWNSNKTAHAVAYALVQQHFYLPVNNKEHGGSECQIREPEGKRKTINVEHGKVAEKHSWKKSNGGSASQADD